MQVINRDSGKYTFGVCVGMLELYQDSLMDLLLAPQPKGKVRLGHSGDCSADAAR